MSPGLPAQSIPLACEGCDMPEPSAQVDFCRKAEGYNGIWWGQTPTHDCFVYKYGGGLGTYPAQQRPQAVFSATANKTFFVYGGAPHGSHVGAEQRERNRRSGELLQMIGCFDHATGKVSRPTLLFDKWTADPHDNPVLAMDGDGYLWVFSPSHSRSTTPSYIHRSLRPYDIDRFITVYKDYFSYPQPWWLPSGELFFFHTRYENDSRGHSGRSLYLMRSLDGRDWSTPELFGRIDLGHYQVTAVGRRKIGTVFDYHPFPAGLEARTNLHYAESVDGGRTWTTAAGQRIELPLREVKNPAVVRDYEGEGMKNYLMDLVFDHEDRPVILYLTTRGFEPGPANQPRRWTTARWTGREWLVQPAMVSDNNYDMGSLYLESTDLWRLIGPTESGSQPYNPGGEMAMWLSRDQGRSWDLAKTLTRNSRFNHTFARRPLNADPGFYAFWADGDTRAPSESRLYFATRDGSVWRLPPIMKSDSEYPEQVR